MIKEYTFNFDNAKVVKASNGEDVALLDECVTHGTAKMLIKLAVPVKDIRRKTISLKIDDVFNGEWSLYP